MTMAGTAKYDDSMLRPIRRTLRKLIWRARVALVVRGVVATLAAALIGILAAMGVAARWVIEDAWMDYALTAMWVLTAAATGVVMLIRPLARAFTLQGIARVLEQRHPELHERISSTVELLTSSDAPELRGSEALIRALAAEAGRDITTVQPRREVTFRRARTPLIVLGATVAVIAALLVIFPHHASPLLAKTIVPVLNIGNLHAGDIDVHPGDKTKVVLASGQSQEITAALPHDGLASRVKTVELRIATASGTDEIREMVARADGTFAQTTGALERSIRYRVRAARALTRYYDITVVPRPDVEAIEIGYDFPEYMHRANVPPRPRAAGAAGAGPIGDGGSGRIEAVAGTVARVRLTLNTPVETVAATFDGKALPVERVAPRTHTFQLPLQLPAADSTHPQWQLQLTDRYGHKSRLMRFDVRVTADAAPVCSLVNAENRPDKVRPTDRVPVPYTVTDDFGISRADMLVRVDSRPAAEIPLAIALTDTAPSTGPHPPWHVAGTAMLDLSALDLRGARKVSVRVQGFDNLPESLGGPQKGVSGELSFDLDVKAERYAMQVQLADELRIRDSLERIYQELTAAKKISGPLRRSMPATVRLTEATTGKVDRLRGHLVEAEETTRRLADATVGGTYPKLSGTLADLADKHIGKARELVGLIKLTDDKARRAIHADEADFQIDRSIAIVSDLLKQFAVWTAEARIAAELDDLARRQEELAAARATTQPADESDARANAPTDDQQWQEAQKEVARDTAQAVRQTPGAMRESLNEQGKRTTDLSQTASALQKSQQALTQNTAEAQKIEQMRRDLGKLAEEQAKLAGKIGKLEQQSQPIQPATQPAAQAHENAAQAAQTLATTQPADALAQQDAAAQALDQTAQKAEEEVARSAAADLARAAEELARKQDQLAERSVATGARQDQAQKAEQAAKAHTARQEEINRQIAQRSQTLAERQEALAGESRKVEAQANPTAGGRASEPMTRAARSLRKGDPGAAAQQARQAAQKARQLAQATDRQASARERSAKGDAQDVAALGRQLQQAAQQARASHQAAARQANAARQAADQAARQAQSAEQAARQAEQQAAQAQGEQAQAAKRAAAQARQRAARAAEKANQARSAADAAAERAEQARQQAEATQRVAANPAAEARRRTEAANQARAQADQARQVADKQEALAGEIAQAAQRERIRPRPTGLQAGRRRGRTREAGSAEPRRRGRQAQRDGPARHSAGSRRRGTP